MHEGSSTHHRREAQERLTACLHKSAHSTAVQEERLEVQSPIAMKPVSFLAHQMAKGSPLYGKTQQDLVQERGFIVVSPGHITYSWA